MTKTLLGLLVAITLYGCASQEPQGPQYDLSLYDGRPIDTLTSDVMPVSEKEAITRGDVARCMNTFERFRFPMHNIKTKPCTTSAVFMNRGAISPWRKKPTPWQWNTTQTM